MMTTQAKPSDSTQLKQTLVQTDPTIGRLGECVASNHRKKKLSCEE